MSGIAGIVRADALPVGEDAPRLLAAAMAYRGPDGRGAWHQGPAALVHALLLTGDEEAPPPQPLSLDGDVWITADARVDDRGTLARALRAAGEDVSASDDAATLILRAYHAWGTECVRHLVGDFVFAVWDAPRRRLFCARDQIGVKPFYYALLPGALVFSNTLDAVRLHPGVSAELDERSVADFLVRGFPLDAERTIWAGVRALPPAHALTYEGGRIDVRRYWEPPRDEVLRYRNPAEYAEHFVDVLSAAVVDRLPNGSASIFLSGGRDSPTVAALAKEAVARGERSTEIRGFTAYYARLFADPEPRFARMVGEALGVPIRWLAVDDYQPFERFESDPLFYRPEPADSPLMAIEVDQWSQAAEHARVLLTGFGGDAVLRESRSRMTRLAAGGHLLRAAWEGAQYAWHHRRLPRPGVRTWLRERRGEGRTRLEAPAWIDPDFARRTELEARLDALAEPPRTTHPLRPEAYEQVVAPLWPSLFTYADPGATRIALEVRHPFMDVRVVRFLLSVPPAQWYNDKGLLRIGMRGRLPDAVLRRPKTPLAGDPLAARLRASGDAWLGGRTLGPGVAPYVDARRVPRVAGGLADEAPDPLWRSLRPLELSLWLRRVLGR